MKKLIVSVICVLFITWPAFAGEDPLAPEAAESLLKESIQAVLDVLEDGSLSSQEQKEKIEAIVDPVFNYELIARLSLGPRNWPRLDREQQAVFIERFVRRLKDSYFDNIAMVQGDAETRVEYGEMRVENNRVHVPVRAGMQNAAVDMLYKFHQSEGEGWRVYDVEINGVSIVASYRSQFNQVLANRTVEEMLDQIRTIEAPGAE